MAESLSNNNEMKRMAQEMAHAEELNRARAALEERGFPEHDIRAEDGFQQYLILKDKGSLGDSNLENILEEFASHLESAPATEPLDQKIVPGEAMDMRFDEKGNLIGADTKIDFGREK